MKLRRNLGMIDRILRAGISLAMIYVGFFGQSLMSDDVARLALGGMGVFLLGIALVGYCPMYAMIGFSTASQRTASTS